MTTAADLATDSTDTARRTRGVGALTLLVAAGLPLAALLTAGRRDVEVQPGLIDWIFVAAIVVVTMVVFGLLVPWALRKVNPAKVAVGLSVTALLVSIVLFWTMVPVILGTAGAWIAYTADDGRGVSPQGLRMTAMILGTLAAVASAVAYVLTS